MKTLISMTFAAVAFVASPVNAQFIHTLDYVDPGVSQEVAEVAWGVAHSLVLDELIDPDSAKFRCVAVSYSEDGKILFVDGDVNSKNSYGGYVGYKMFVVKLDHFNRPIEPAYISSGLSKSVSCDVIKKKKMKAAVQ